MNFHFSHVNKSITLSNCRSRNTFHQLTGVIQREGKEKLGDIFNHELLQLCIIQQNVMMKSHLVTGNS